MRDSPPSSQGTAPSRRATLRASSKISSEILWRQFSTSTLTMTTTENQTLGAPRACRVEAPSAVILTRFSNPSSSRRCRRCSTPPVATTRRRTGVPAPPPRRRNPPAATSSHTTHNGVILEDRAAVLPTGIQVVATHLRYPKERKDTSSMEIAHSRDTPMPHRIHHTALEASLPTLLLLAEEEGQPGSPPGRHRSSHHSQAHLAVVVVLGSPTI